MSDRKVFKLGLVLSCAIHFALIMLFPTFRASLQKIPAYIEVTLMTATLVKPAQGKPPAPAPVKAVVPRKVLPAKEVAPQKVLPKVSPVEINVRPSERVPVLNPRVESESEIKISFPVLQVEPLVEAVKQPYRPEKEEGVARFAPLPREGVVKITPGIISPVRGNVSYQRSVGEGEGSGSGAGGEDTPGFRFKGLGGRRVLREVKPGYPEEAEKQGITGNPVLKFSVLSTGEVLEVTVLRSSGWAEFDRAASQALRYYLFSPIPEDEGIKKHEVEFFFGF